MPGPPIRPVALLFHEGDGGGASLALVRVLDELSARGWSFAAYVDGPGRLSELLAGHGVDVTTAERQVGFSRRWLRHPPGPAAKLQAMPRWLGGLARWLRATQPALVHVNSLFTLPDGLVARGLGLPAFLLLHEMLPAGPKGDVARRAVRVAGFEVGAVSEACADRFAGRSGPRPHLIRNGVPMPERPTVRPADPDPLVVGTIGYVCERKGTDLFVDVAERLLAERSDLEFRIVGAHADAPDVDWGAHVLRRAAAAGVRHIEGADGLAQLQEFDLFVMPSRYDPYPLTVLEAMASGVPVVGSRVDGIVEQVVPGTGLLARPGDAADLTARTRELLTDGDRRRAMGAAAREHALQAFRLSDQAAAQERAWLATLAGASGTAVGGA